MTEAYGSAAQAKVTAEHRGNRSVAHDPDVTSRPPQIVLRRVPKREHLRPAAKLAGVVPAELLAGSRYS